MFPGHGALMNSSVCLGHLWAPLADMANPTMRPTGNSLSSVRPGQNGCMRLNKLG